MNPLIRPLVLLLPVLLIACSGSDGNGPASGPADARPQLELTFAEEPPLDLPGIAARCALDVRYGEAERNLLDICLPDSEQPTPLVLYYHGGAYVAGDKNSVYGDLPDDVREFLQAGIAFATINYPFLDTNPPFDDVGVIRPLTHSARALQFLRYHFESLNIDPEQVASYGASAGASTSLWLGTHDDLADPDNPDPVLRESTRLKAVGALYTQGTLNFLAWEEILYPVTEPLVAAGVLQSTEILSTAALLGADALLFSATGTDSIEELQSPEQLPYMENLDAIGNMDAGDAPVYAYNDNALFEGDLLNLFLHHTLHVLALHEKAQDVGLENVMYALDPVFNLEDPSGEEHVSFLIRHIR
jgi:hypothetical protein